MARLFFALYPRAAERAALAAMLPAGRVTGRVIPVDNLHMTLAFLGDVGEAVVDTLCAVEDAVPVPPFELCFGELAFWEGPRTRVLVPDTLPAEAVNLHCGIQRLLGDHELPFDRRQWSPHITLERRAVPEPTGPVSPVTVRFDEYVLMASETRQEGVVYTPLARWRLPSPEAV